MESAPREGPTVRFFEHGDLGGQGAGTQHHGEILGLFGGERAGDGSLAAADFLLDHGGALDNAVEHDGELLMDQFFGDPFKLIRAPRTELDGYAWLIAFIESGAGVHDVLTGEQGRLVEDEAAGEIVLAGGGPGARARDQRIPRRPRRHEGGSGADVVSNAVEGELCGAPDELKGARGVGDAGKLYLDLIVALAADVGFRHAEGVDAAAERADGLIHDAFTELFFPFGAEGDEEFFPGSGRDGRPDCHLSESVAQQVGELFDSLVFERHEFQRSTVGLTEEAGPYSRIVGAGTDILPQKGQRLGNGLIDVCAEGEVDASAQIEAETNGIRQPRVEGAGRHKEIDGYAGGAEKSRQQRDAGAPTQGTHEKSSWSVRGPWSR